MNILLVDQDRELVEMLAFAFTRAGFNVVAAHDAATALKLPANQEPDLVISEVSLDPFDGYELLSRLRQRSQVPVILLTSHNTEEDQLRGFELGADDYLIKPFSYRVLLARVRAVLRHNGGGDLLPNSKRWSSRRGLFGWIPPSTASTATATRSISPPPSSACSTIS